MHIIKTILAIIFGLTFLKISFGSEHVKLKKIKHEELVQEMIRSLENNERKRALKKGFTLTCPSNNIERLPHKFLFSYDKKTTWYFLNTNWYKLKTITTDTYYFLGGLVQPDNCDNNGQNFKISIKFDFIIDRSTLNLYKKVSEDQIFLQCPQTFQKHQILSSYNSPCKVSKNKF